MENQRTLIRNSPMQAYRSAAMDCYVFVYYGTCGFGSNCKFNHPVHVHPSTDQEAIRENRRQTYARIPCKFFLAGRCKFGTTCKYDHFLPMTLVNLSLHFNSLGFPKRWGMPDCSFFIRTGDCHRGIACMFHHPEPVLYHPEQGYCSNVGGEVGQHQNIYTQISNGWNQRRVTITIKEPCVTLNDVGLPLRPGKSLCRYYENSGCCKFGKGCKFNHPMKVF